jgi:hypothetical protein
MRCSTRSFTFEPAAKHPNVGLLDPTGPLLNQYGLCRVAKDGNSLYWDDNHLSHAGSMELRPLFEPILKKLSEERDAGATTQVR